ncbi:hypothetical protein QTP88_022212 [Uroleucon formosanum]
MRTIGGLIKSTPLKWLPVLSNIAPPKLRREHPLLQDWKNISSKWKNDWTIENPDNQKLVTNPTIKQPGFYLERSTWVTLNRIRTGHELAAFLGNHSNIPVETNSIQNLNQIELDKYLSLPSVGLNCNPLQWWKIFNSEFPTLAKLTMKYLCIQGTSVPSERIFSCAGNVITDHRSSLSSEHAEELIFLSMNAKYVSK